jgi:hypothetical protein
MAVELAAAYVSLVPSFKGGTAVLRREIEGPVTQAGREAGAKAGDAIEDGLAKGAERGGRRAGTSITSLIGSAAVLAGIAKVTDASSNLQQSVGATSAVFGEASAAIDEFAEGAAESVGLSERAARETTAQIGALLKGFGADAAEAGEQAIQLTEIGADLAATFGGTTAEAVDALGAALRGESDPAERFGISLRAASIDAKAVELGLVGAGEEVDAYSRSQAAMALILEQTADAQGQFARESDSAAGAAQIAAAQTEDAAASLGDALLPIYSRAAEVVGAVAGQFERLPNPVQTGLVALTGVVALAGPMRTVSDALGSSGLAGSVSQFVRNSGGVVSAVGRVTPVIAGLGAVAFTVKAALDNYNDTKAEAARISTAYRDAIENETGALKDNVDAVTAAELATGDVGTFLRENAANYDLLNHAIREQGEALEFLDDEIIAVVGGLKSMDEVVEEAGLGGTALGEELIRLGDAAKELGNEDLFDLFNRLDGLSDRFDEQTIAAENTAAAEASVGDEAKNAAAGVGTFTETLQPAVEETKTFAEELAEAVDSLGDFFGFTSGVEEAQVGFRETIRGAWQEIESLNEALADPTERQDAFTSFLVDARDGALEVAEALAAQGASTDEVTAEINRLIAEAAGMGDEFGLTEGEVQGLLGALGLLPNQVEVQVETSGLSEALALSAELLAVLNAFREQDFNPDFDARFGGPRAAGGPVVGRTTYLVGENGPELFTPKLSGQIIPTEALVSAGVSAAGGSGDFNVGGIQVINQGPQETGETVVRALRREKVLSGAVR